MKIPFYFPSYRKQMDWQIYTGICDTMHLHSKTFIELNLQSVKEYYSDWYKKRKEGNKGG